MRSRSKFGAYGLAALGVALLWIYAFQTVPPDQRIVLPQFPAARNGSTEVVPQAGGGGHRNVTTQVNQHSSAAPLGRRRVVRETSPAAHTLPPAASGKTGRTKGPRPGRTGPGGATPPTSPGATPPTSPGATAPTSPGGATAPTSPGATPPTSPGGATPPTSPGGATPPTSSPGPVASPPVETTPSSPSSPSAANRGGDVTASTGSNGTPAAEPTDGGRTTAGVPPSQCPGPDKAVTNASVTVSNGIATATFQIAPGCSSILVSLGIYQASPPALFKTVSGSFDAGGPFTLSAPLPACQYKADLSSGNQELGSASGGTTCASPPPPPPPPPPSPPPPPPCDHGNGPADRHGDGGQGSSGGSDRSGSQGGDDHHGHGGSPGTSGHKGCP